MCPYPQYSVALSICIPNFDREVILNRQPNKHNSRLIFPSWFVIYTIVRVYSISEPLWYIPMDLQMEHPR